MKREIMGIAGLIACAGLVACAVPNNAPRLSQQTVQYSCGVNGAVPLNVQYTFQGNDPVTALIIYQGQAINLNRDTVNRVDLINNTFRGNGYTWVTDNFTGNNAVNVNGNNANTTNATNATVSNTNNVNNVNTGNVVNGVGSMLTRDVPQTVNGQTTTVSTIVANYCRAAGTITR